MSIRIRWCIILLRIIVRTKGGPMKRSALRPKPDQHHLTIITGGQGVQHDHHLSGDFYRRDFVGSAIG